MERTVRKMLCCGAAEYHGVVGTPKEILRSIHQAYKSNGPWGMLFFTWRLDQSGEALVNYIKENKLGYIVRTGEPVYNPNSGNRLYSAIWHTDWDAFKKWYKDNKKDKTGGWFRNSNSIPNVQVAGQVAAMDLENQVARARAVLETSPRGCQCLQCSQARETLQRANVGQQARR